MSEHKLLDGAADVLPVGLQPTPFGEVWQALQQVAAQVWDVDPSVYRAGIAWLWYAVNRPDALDSDTLRAMLVAALISEQAPMVKDWQTNAELVEYLRIWRTYSPTYAKLEAIFSTFGAHVEVRPISDAESQGVVPVDDRRLAFYLRVENFDAARPLTLDEVYQIAVRATPLGSRPVPYYALVGSSDVFAGPASAGVVRALWASEPAEPVPMSFVVVDSSTGAIVHGFNSKLTAYELPSVVLNSEDGYETYELPSVSLPTPNVVIGVPISGPVQTFWLSDEGRNKTSDKTFTVVGNPLFDEDGSIARNELYERSVPLSFMQYDGNMFEADNDSDTVRYLPTTSRLTLSIPGDSTTRGKSAWSVQVAKLFVLSYANTQLPDVQIELPNEVVDTYGTQITLPTIDGEYQSGGKTWKPSAWDIGAFGSSYSLTGDVVAHLIFKTEIDIYASVGTPVTIPDGYIVQNVYCEALFIRADSVTKTDQTHISFLFNGEDLYCDDTNLSLFGVKVTPCLQVFTLQNNTYTGFYISVRSSFAGTNRPTSSAATEMNTNGVFLRGTAQASFQIINSLFDHLSTRPAWISRTDENENRIPYYFRMPSSLWQVQNGTLTWLGDTTDDTTPAYWYNLQGVRIHCVKFS